MNFLYPINISVHITSFFVFHEKYKDKKKLFEFIKKKKKHSIIIKTKHENKSRCLLKLTDFSA